MTEVFEPPTYSPSSPSPHYTAAPTDAEVSLDRSVRVLSRHDRATHSVVREYDSKGFGFTVTFTRQREDVGTIPTYQQGDLVAGYVQLQARGTPNIASISIKLAGEVELSADVMGHSQISFFSEMFDLWKQDSAETVPPNALHFSVPLPATINHVNGVDRPPPSSIRTPNMNGVFAVIQYSLKVTVQQKGFRGVFKKTHNLVTPLRFIQRSHPPAPPLSVDQSFLSTLKIAPDEWCNLALDLSLHEIKTDIRCTLAIPASRVFHIATPIPLHFQMAGPAAPLRQFLPEALASLFPSSSQDEAEWEDAFHLLDAELPLPSSEPLPAPEVISGTSKCQVTIFLQRRFAVNAYGDAMYRSTRLSDPAQLELVYSDVRAGWLAWNGVLVPTPDEYWAPEPLRIHGLSVTDYIAVDVRPSQSATGPRERGSIIPRAQLFPIKLVTDPFPL
ncbi:hypothetical protein BKA62DRAFT_702441 [Auriculariales sp. MPI-PUGE-AT-0066]|nr:hypothetical protein BKA62DRAFT_702441 [Auriculariales sp. MPI-PUGE-AT-0066]